MQHTLAHPRRKANSNKQTNDQTKHIANDTRRNARMRAHAHSARTTHCTKTSGNCTTNSSKTRCKTKPLCPTQQRALEQKQNNRCETKNHQQQKTRKTINSKPTRERNKQSTKFHMCTNTTMRLTQTSAPAWTNNTEQLRTLHKHTCKSHPMHTVTWETSENKQMSTNPYQTKTNHTKPTSTPQTWIFRKSEAAGGPEVVRRWSAGGPEVVRRCA